MYSSPFSRLNTSGVGEAHCQETGSLAASISHLLNQSHFSRIIIANPAAILLFLVPLDLQKVLTAKGRLPASIS